MNVIRKLCAFFCAAAAFLCFSVSPVPAFPGINSQLPDVSGQYVYYRDYSFQYEAYIGFLYYDEGTYAMRYFSPAQPLSGIGSGGGQTTSVPNSIELLFTVNTGVNYTDMTGEKFITTLSSSDTEIVNYMHDLVYELSARRRQLYEVPVAEPVEVRDEFLQFGGSVLMTYSSAVPVFGLQSIKAADGALLFELVSVGALASSDDTSFSDFKGFPVPLVDKERNFRTQQAEPSIQVRFNSQQVLLDPQWSQAADNMFMLGDAALLVMSDFSATGDISEIFDVYSRNFCLGSTGTYSDWRNRVVTRTEDSLSVEILYYMPESNAVSRDFKILHKKADGSWNVLSLTVFDNAYKANRHYFDVLLESYQP